MSDNKKTDDRENENYTQVAVNAYIINKENKLLLLKSSKQKDKYVAPGGKIAKGESEIEALLREVKEETNLDIIKPKFIGIKKLDNDIIMLNYKVTEQEGKVKLCSEHNKFDWKKPKEWTANKHIHDNVKEIIEECLLVDKNDYEEKYKRALADYQNLVKQAAQERLEFVKYANEQLLYDILPVYDNLKMSLQHADKEVEKNGWLKGIQYVVKQFKSALQERGVEEIKTKGEKFDPQLMEAIEGKGDRVKKEAKAGYKLNGKVIIPAKVILE